MPSKDHNHKYKKLDIGREKEYWIMQCVDCSHYTPMKSELSCPVLMGKIARCNRCDCLFVLDKRSLRMVNPCCEDCIKRKINEKDKEADKFFEDLLK